MRESVDVQVSAIRAFNRFYTRKIGVIDGTASSPFSLAEARVLYELAHGERPTATDIRKELGLDAGYMSRILREFERRKLITKDGVTVAKEIELQDPLENMGAQMVREVASKTSDVAGDGTTTATVLAQAIFREGVRTVAAGASPMALKRGIDKAVEVAVGEIMRLSREVKGDITVEESKTMETTLEVVEGMQFDRGYLSPYFVTDPERMECVLEDVRILI